ncbi:MAG TPA: S41 family peptidase [Vicinamibacterales bacterium]
MSSRTRWIVLAISAPIIAFAIVGGFLGKVMARETTYPHLKVFNDVLDLITNSYVDEVNVDKVMNGAMRGLADSLDADSAYLTADEVKQAQSSDAPAAGDIGLELTRQYYLRVISARENSPAAKAGLRTGDYVRMIDDKPTRELSVWEGTRALHGAPGSKVKLTIIRGNAADPHVVELVREALPASDVAGRIAAPGVGYIRVIAIGSKTTDQLKSKADELVKAGASRLIVDVRRTSGAPLDAGLALARLFVPKGTLAMKESKNGARETIAASSGDGAITLPAEVLIDTGTTGAAELFAAAMDGNKRAELVGERTLGRAAVQTLVKLPDGSGLWLSTTRYLTPAGNPLHEKGLEPTVPVDGPEAVDFGQPAPTADPILDKAIERFAEKKAA